MPKLSLSQILKPQIALDSNDFNIESLNHKSIICSIDISAQIANDNLSSEQNILNDIKPPATSENQSRPPIQITPSIYNEKALLAKLPTQTAEAGYFPHLCRFCFEEESGTNKLIHPCQCLGSIKHIHEKCLKTWVNSSFVAPIEQSLNGFPHLPKPKCEICDCEYLFSFSFDFVLPQAERCNVIKSAINYFILYLVFLFSLGAVLYLIVTSIFNLATPNKNYLIIGLVCLALIGQALLMIRELKLIKGKKMKMILIDWGFFNYEDYDQVLASEETQEADKDGKKRKEKWKWVLFLEDHKWYTNLIYRKRQVKINNFK